MKKLFISVLALTGLAIASPVIQKTCCGGPKTNTQASLASDCCKPASDCCKPAAECCKPADKVSVDGSQAKTECETPKAGSEADCCQPGAECCQPAAACCK